MMRIVVLLVMIMTATSQAVARAAQGDVGGTIQGVVRGSNSAPMPDLTVHVESGDLVATTDTKLDGSFAIMGLPSGTYRLEVIGPTGLVVGTASVTLTVGAMIATVNVSATRAATAAVGAVEGERFRAGPFGITPSLALSSAGIDTNVFNEAHNPRSDTTLAITPETSISLRAGRLRGAGTARGDYLYFQKYSGERSLNGAADGRLELAAGRLTPWAAGGVNNGRRRVEHEIDLRARRSTIDAEFGVDGRIASRTFLAASAKRSMYGFGAAESFRGSNLQEVLNHQTDSAGLEFRQGVTSAITLVVQAEVLQHRFRFAPQRDADSVLTQAGLNLEKPDVAQGRLRIGYRRFDAVGGGVSDHRGIVASVEGGVTMWRRTRVQVAGTRDITYSFEAVYPYYVGTGGTVVLTQPLGKSWDVEGRVSGQRLDYQSAPGVTAAGRLDQYGLLGGGFGYDASRDVRIGLDAAREHRDSPIPNNRFIGYTTGISVTLGHPRQDLASKSIRP